MKDEYVKKLDRFTITVSGGLDRNVVSIKSKLDGHKEEDLFKTDIGLSVDGLSLEDDLYQLEDSKLRGIIENTSIWKYFYESDLRISKGKLSVFGEFLIPQTVTRRIKSSDDNVEIYVGDVVENDFGTKILGYKDYLTFLIAFEFQKTITNEIPVQFLDTSILIKKGDVFIDTEWFEEEMGHIIDRIILRKKKANENI